MLIPMKIYLISFSPKWLLIYIFYIFLFWYFLAGCHVGGDGPGWARLLLPGGRFRRRPRGRWWWWFMFLPSFRLSCLVFSSFVCLFLFFLLTGSIADGNSPCPIKKNKKIVCVCKRNKWRGFLQLCPEEKEISYKRMYIICHPPESG